VCLAVTHDFVTYERFGAATAPSDKDAALFPTLFNGRYGMIHRPTPQATNLGAHMWLSWSHDLRAWGDHQLLLPARHHQWWDAKMVGLGPPPLLTANGWMVCYHNEHRTKTGATYRLGLALLDRNDPGQVLARGNEWIFAAHMPYERKGDASDVVFPCGWLLDADGDTLRMYYGAADSSVCLASASIRELLEYLDRHPCGNEDCIADLIGS
jgi:predicted GH43/DUF377 family glycosyl hydrolase